MKQKVRKVVIPVAGLGTRFLPATKVQPKEMLPIIDRPGLQYLIEEVVDAGITNIILITNAYNKSLEDYFDATHYELETRLREKRKRDELRILKKIQSLARFVYVRQKGALGTADAVAQAASVVGDEPFAMLWPDDFFISEENQLSRMIRAFDEYQAPIMGVRRVARRDVVKYGIINPRRLTKGFYEVVGVVEKPTVAKAPSNLASFKGYILPPSILPFLRRQGRGVGGERNLPDAVAAYNTRHAVYAVELEGEYYDLGSKLGWLQANVAMGLRRPELRTAFRHFLTSLARP